MLELGLSPLNAFQKADKNGNGIITIDELRLALKELLPAEEVPLMEIKKIAMAFDVNRNGSIDQEEFIALFQKSREQPVFK